MSGGYHRTQNYAVTHTDPKITKPDLANRLTISVEEAAQVLSIGRSAAYEAVHRGDIPHVRIGRRYLVPVPRLLAMLGTDSAP